MYNIVCKYNSIYINKINYLKKGIRSIFKLFDILLIGCIYKTLYNFSIYIYYLIIECSIN